MASGAKKTSKFNSLVLYSTIILNSLPDDKILDWFKLKAFTDDKISITEK